MLAYVVNCMISNEITLYRNSRASITFLQFFLLFEIENSPFPLTLTSLREYYYCTPYLVEMDDLSGYLLRYSREFYYHYTRTMFDIGW